jgi:hypothetical protein
MDWQAARRSIYNHGGRTTTRALALALSFVLSACAGAETPAHHHHGHDEIIHLPSGSFGYLIKCKASAQSDCVKDAGKDCLDLGYTVVDKHDPGPWFAFGNPLFVALSEPDASLTIRCNTADGLYPGDEARVAHQ